MSGLKFTMDHISRVYEYWPDITRGYEGKVNSENAKINEARTSWTLVVGPNPSKGHSFGPF